MVPDIECATAAREGKRDDVTLYPGQGQRARFPVRGVDGRPERLQAAIAPDHFNRAMQPI